MNPRSLRETFVYLRDDLQQQLKSPRALVLLLSYVLLELAMTLPYLGLAKLAAEQLTKKNPQAKVAIDLAGGSVWARAFTELTGSAEEGLAMSQIPLPALYTFTLAALFLPLLVMLLSSDSVADDLRSGHIRYLSLRSSRGSLLWGRTLARTLLLSATVLLGTLGCYGLFWWKLDDLAPDAFGHFLRFGLLLAAMVPTYSTLAALCSTLVRSSFFALLLGIFVLLFLGVLDLASSTAGVITPNHFKLLLYSPLRWEQGLAAYLGFAALYGALAHLRLVTRDI